MLPRTWSQGSKQSEPQFFNGLLQSLKKEERKKEFESMSPEYFQEQYLANVEPLLRKTDWGEIYNLLLHGHEKDQGELWVHPEQGLKLKRKG